MDELDYSFDAQWDAIDARRKEALDRFMAHYYYEAEEEIEIRLREALDMSDEEIDDYAPFLDEVDALLIDWFESDEFFEFE